MSALGALFELRYWWRELRHRAWRGWCIFAFDHDPSDEVEWLWGVLRRQAAIIRKQDDALQDLARIANATVARADDADEP